MIEMPANEVTSTLASGITTTTQNQFYLTTTSGFTNTQYHLLITDGVNSEIAVASGITGNLLTVYQRASEPYMGQQIAHTYAAISGTVTIVSSVAGVTAMIQQQGTQQSTLQPVAQIDGIPQQAPPAYSVGFSNIWTNYSAVTNNSQIGGCCLGPDGNIWFSDIEAGNGVGKITPAGVVTRYAIPTAVCINIIAGPDGNLWTNSSTVGSGIYKVTTNGTYTQYPISGAELNGICMGSDGYIYASDGVSGHGIWKFNISTGVSTQIPLASTIAAPPGLGPDGNIWIGTSSTFGDSTTTGVWKVTPGGITTNYLLGGNYAGTCITGPDGNVWAGGADVNNGLVINPWTGGYTLLSSNSTREANAVFAGPDGLVYMTCGVYVAIVNPWTLAVTLVSGNPSGVHPQDACGICMGNNGQMWITDVQYNAGIMSIPVTTQVGQFSSQGGVTGGLAVNGGITVSGNVTVTGTMTIVSGYGLIVETISNGGGGQTLGLIDTNGGNGIAYFRANGSGINNGGFQVINSSFSYPTLSVNDNGNLTSYGTITAGSGIQSNTGGINVNGTSALSGTLTVSGIGTFWGTQTFENQTSFPGGVSLPNGGLNVGGGTNNILGTTLLSGAITVSGVMQGTAIYNDPVSVVSATHTAIYNETTIYSGTTAAQTIFLPSGNLVNGCANNVVNYATVSVTVASGSAAQINNFGTLGNVVVQPDHQYDFTYNVGNNTWYVEDSNDITTTYGSGMAGQYLTPSGAGVIAYTNPYGYVMPANYVAPYKAWTSDPLMAGSALTLITGTAYYQSIWIPTACTISGISLYATTFAATDTLYLGLFSATTQLAVCSGKVGTGSAGWITALISGGVYNVSQPGLYYIGMVVSGSTTFQSAGPNQAFSAALTNMGIATGNNTLAGLRGASVVIGQRALYANGNTVSGTMSQLALYPTFALS